MTSSLGSGDRRVAMVAANLAARADDVALVLGDAVLQAARESRDTVGEFHHRVADVCAANVRSILLSLTASNEFDPTQAAAVGVARAQAGQSLAAAIGSDRLGFRRLWGLLASEGRFTSEIGREALSSLTVQLHGVEDLYTRAMVAGYRREQTRKLLGEPSHRSVLLDELLQGQIHDRWAMWTTANQLRLPVTGPYVIVTAENPAVGVVGLPEIESKLRSLDVYSAWQELPDLQIGIVHVFSDLLLRRALALISRLAATGMRVGVSDRFDDLRHSARALHVAKVTMQGRSEPSASVAVFDGSLLAIAAVSEPEVMARSVRSIIERFSDLPDDERATLFRTFRVWQHTEASVRETAGLLSCHPNTVRQRLRRIEHRTARSLSRPRDVAELCLVFEVYDRLM
ncbi:MAG TPA: helix-turn-helix domain-containing protein [Mycobacterium sp.]|nr:helix-turn-helix domain-containing protein [Mycobacterium sp.]